MAVPEEFFRLIESYGAPWVGALRGALAGEPSVAVRLNSRKAQGLTPRGGEPVKWCKEGFHLPARPSFTFDPALHQGLYYVQEASSMFVAQAVRQIAAHLPQPLTVLDACAAPGGKTTALIDALPDGAVVVANEYVAKRAAILRENLAKWGYPLTVVTQGDTARFASAEGAFGLILADVPCSGEGMMRKDADAVAQWSPELIRQCVERQREIVDNLWPALRPGGYMIYSTCTFNREEDEEMLRYLHERYGAEGVRIVPPEGSGIEPELGGEMPACRFVPGLVRGEGLFMGVVRKPLSEHDGEPQPVPTAKKPKMKNRASGRKDAATRVPQQVEGWIKADYPCRLYMLDDKVMAEFVTSSGFSPMLEVATVKGKNLIPSQQLALSMALESDAFACVEVSSEQAVDYLRCEAVTLHEGAPRGIVLLTYGGRPLGFVKNLGNRANNLYSHSWRILSARPQPLPERLLD